MIVFGDKSTGKYVETEYIDDNKRAVITWHNDPAVIVYYHNVRNESHYVNLSSWLYNILPLNDKCKDIFQARDVLDLSFNKEEIAKSLSEIWELKNKAFDNLRDADYWFGVFDALRWVLGDEVEEFEDV